MTSPKDDAAADLLIKEVDEDLRQENFQKLWKKHGNTLIGGATAVVLAVAGSQAWTSWTQKQNMEAGGRFDQAVQLIQSGDAAKGSEILGRLAVEGPEGYKILAEMKLGEMKAKAGESAAAAAIYDRVAAMSGADDAYRNLARLKAAYLKVESGDPAQAAKSVEALATDGGAWRHSAREIMALAALKQGDKVKAVDHLRKLSDDPGAPAGIRARAAELLAALGPQS